MDSQPKSHISGPFKALPILDSTLPHTFLKPSKRICEGHDVPRFLTSKAYVDLGIFVMQLNIAMCPRKFPTSPQIQTWQLDLSVPFSEAIRRLQELLQKVDAIREEAPPETGPRRFGNASFRRWYEILEARVYDLLRTYLPANILSFGSHAEGISVLDEIVPYFLGSFGSPQRLDYGTGHELSFLAFLGCIWKLGGFSEGYTKDGSLERSIVMGVIEPYVPPLILYTLTLIFTTAIYASFDVLSSRILSSLRDLTGCGVSTITLFYRTFLDLPSTVRLLKAMLLCLLRVLYQKRPNREKLPKKTWLTAREYTTCILRLLDSSMMSRRDHFGNIVQSFLTFQEFGLDGGKLIRFVWQA